MWPVVTEGEAWSVSLSQSLVMQKRLDRHVVGMWTRDCRSMLDGGAHWLAQPSMCGGDAA